MVMFLISWIGSKMIKPLLLKEKMSLKNIKQHPILQRSMMERTNLIH